MRVGDPFESDTQMGPLVAERQRDRVEGYIAKGKAEGATLATGGGRPQHLKRGYYVEPTVFGNVDNSSTIAQEEIFGFLIDQGRVLYVGSSNFAGWHIARAITIAILAVLRGAARDIYRRLMDAVDPDLVAATEREASAIEGVQGVDDIRLRWVGHELQAELNITVDQDLPVSSAHRIAETVRQDLTHHLARLTRVRIHIDPCGHDGSNPHAVGTALVS